MTDFSAEPVEDTTASPRRVYLHVGAPKTGTTYLQTMLSAHRDRLRADGCCYPVLKSSAHHVEARDLRNARPRRGYVNPQEPGSWDRLVRRVHEWDGDGPVLISSELLVFARRERAERAIRSLQPAEVHIVLTLRDLVRQIPAVWQETVKNGNTMAYEDFLRHLVEDEEGNGPRGIWNGQDPVRILDRWAAGVPPERVHLVTVPPPGSEPRLLWTRFARLLGVDPDDYPPVPKGANTSLGLAETEVVRRINTQVTDAPWPFYSKHIKNGIAQGVLAGASDGPRLVLPEALLPLVEQRTKRIVDTLAGRDYDIAGDLDDLLPPAGGVGVGPVPEPDVQRLAEASAVAADYLARNFGRSWKRAQRSQRSTPARVRRRPGRSRSGRGGAVRATLVRLSRRYAAVDLLRRGHRFARRRGRG